MWQFEDWKALSTQKVQLPFANRINQVFVQKSWNLQLAQLFKILIFLAISELL